MNKMILSTISTLFLLSVGVVNAVEADFVTIDSVQVRHDGSFQIETVEQHANASNCYEGGKAFLVSVGQNGVTTEGIQNLLSASFIAVGSGNKVSIEFDSGTGNCHVRYIKVRK